MPYDDIDLGQHWPQSGDGLLLDSTKQSPEPLFEFCIRFLEENHYFKGLVQDCSNSIDNKIEFSGVGN